MRIVKILAEPDVSEDDITIYKTWSEVLTEPGELVYVELNGSGFDAAADIIDALVGEADVEYV
jgi:hypothetical protein